MTTRRTLLAGSLASAATLSLSPHSSATAEPSLDIIDCHTHFYDPTRPGGIPWPPKGSSLYRTFLPKHLRALPHAQTVTGTVIVEASSRLEDNQWLLDIARDDPFVVGIVGHLNPGQKEYVGHVRRFAKNPLFRGIRVGQGVVSSVLKSGDMSVFKILQDHDLELDVNGGPTMPLVVSRLAQQMPGLRILVNHIGNVKIDRNAPSTDWAKAIRAAAEPTTFAIGTEINLVQRLAAEHPQHTIFCLDPVVCPCSTMYRIHPGYLAWTLEGLVAGRVENRITVPAEVADPARVALERMLAAKPPAA